MPVDARLSFRITDGRAGSTAAGDGATAPGINDGRAGSIAAGATRAADLSGGAATFAAAPEGGSSM